MLNNDINKNEIFVHNRDYTKFKSEKKTEKEENIKKDNLYIIIIILKEIYINILAIIKTVLMIYDFIA